LVELTGATCGHRPAVVKEIDLPRRGIAMFRPQEIQARLRERPFRPIRLVVSEGLRYDINHPELLLVGQRDLIIGHPSPEDPKVYDRITRVAMVHLVGIEDLPTPTSPGSNGSSA
jgi:hypothetical protein